jgi:hypothetical protein
MSPIRSNARVSEQVLIATQVCTRVCVYRLRIAGFLEQLRGETNGAQVAMEKSGARS